ncbi:MAG: T9SS type A sorting domain-containing protein [Chitinophagales bacterium]|jgi:hypothetical protein|nr:T9SS type A sorting domain-containing protein [Chitinophagales bacterium]
MKLRLLLLFLFPLLANAQDWALFPYGQRSFYYNGDSTNLLEFKQDSTVIIGETQHLYFNQRAPDPDLQNCFDEFDDIDFETLELEWSGDSILFYDYYFSETPFYILLNKPVGTSWVISNSYAGSAWEEVIITYDSSNTENVFTNIDSVKYFSFSVDGGASGEFSIDKVIFKLSKSFGLLEYIPFSTFLYPTDCETCYKTHKLVGYILPTDTAGIIIPKWSDYFNYQPGDVLKWYWTSDYSGTEGYWMDTIISMEKNTDSIVVTFTRAGVLNKYIYYREALEYCLQAPNNSIIYAPRSPHESSFIDSYVFIVGEIDYISIVQNYSPFLYSQQRTLSSKYLQDTLSCFIDGPIDGAEGFTFDTYRGLTGEFDDSYFGLESTYLIGSIIGGIVWGDVSPVNIIDALPQNKLLNFYPNPASIEISINTVLEGNYNFHIYSISGQTLGSGKLKDNSINIEALNSGVFILELENEKEILMGRFIKL